MTEITPEDLEKIIEEGSREKAHREREEGLSVLDEVMKRCEVTGWREGRVGEMGEIDILDSHDGWRVGKIEIPMYPDMIGGETFGPKGWHVGDETEKQYFGGFAYKPPKTVREQTLDSAKECVCKNRNDEYGEPEDSFGTIARLWSACMGKEFTPSDVALMLGMVKIARLAANSGHRDSWVDLAGYAACGAECAAKNDL